MLRRILIILLAIILFTGIVAGAVSYSTARSGPYLPGERFFAAQTRAEQLWLNRLVRAGEPRANSLLDLLERRVDNLDAALGGEYQLVALSYLDIALNQAIDEIEAAPEEAQPALKQRLLRLTERALALLDGLELAEAGGDELATAVSTLNHKLISLQTALSNPEDSAIADIATTNTDLDSVTEAEPADDGDVQGIPTSLENPLDVPFPEGSLEHDFFPLQAGHDNLKCSTCHTGSTYKGTSPTCVSCHAKDEPHEGQFGTDCAACHDVTVWTAVSFDHSLMGNQDCANCHTPPENHWVGACSACHSDTANFANAVFNHDTIGTQDCAGCHTPPANHWAGACSACHSDTSNFANAVFNHATVGGQDCAACHSAPANHYAGACSACHSDTSNFANAVFNHATIGGTDCAACHSAPANHFAGACAACHQDTGNFRNANFDHATIGGTDCAACHGAPANHWGGACSACHTDTGNFKNANFNHATIGGTDCSACHGAPANHWGGACSACHQDTGNFKNANFNHSTIGGTDCSACHNAPANHFAGACSTCHQDTGNFGNASFNHAGLTDCASCHQPPANHYAGQCSDCHSTDTFSGASFNHSFPTNHEGANNNCETCHPGGNTSSWTCTACHSQEKMDEEHDDESGYNGSNCTQCHPDGRKHDD